METSSHQEREAVLDEWRTAGEHFVAVTRKLAQAFRDGWRKDAGPAKRTGWHEELQAFLGQLEEATHAAREAAGQTTFREELDRATELTKHAAADTRETIRKDVKYVAGLLNEAEHM